MRWPRRMRRAVAALAVASMPLVGGSQASAETVMTAAEFEETCTRVDNTWISFCNGYVQGVADFLELSGAACITPGTTRTTIVTLIDRATFSRIRDGSIPPDTPALSLAIGVLEAAYPC
jgi:hypothetical protein